MNMHLGNTAQVVYNEVHALFILVAFEIADYTDRLLRLHAAQQHGAFTTRT